ncbi:TSL-kinase interacting protein 1 [Platanthera guangdongensis]|uniref:TSL-kinase interacting protein 1 n=1 Tax=Platanthera guangdongensis TaxID=2320717 RepID=A0ABR2MBS2_9ASPA
MTEAAAGTGGNHGQPVAGKGEIVALGSRICGGKLFLVTCWSWETGCRADRGREKQNRDPYRMQPWQTGKTHPTLAYWGGDARAGPTGISNIGMDTVYAIVMEVVQELEQERTDRENEDIISTETEEEINLNTDRHIQEDITAIPEDHAPDAEVQQDETNLENINVDEENVMFEGELTDQAPTAETAKERLVEAAAYKRWEKAAMAGVSLVADAAEQLERVANRENCTFTQDMHRVSEICCHGVGDTIMQTREKLKLQLFPIDEDTRQSLEKEELVCPIKLCICTEYVSGTGTFMLQDVDCRWREEEEMPKKGLAGEVLRATCCGRGSAASESVASSTKRMRKPAGDALRARGKAANALHGRWSGTERSKVGARGAELGF